MMNYRPIEGIYSILKKDRQQVSDNDLKELKNVVSEVINEKNNIEIVLKTQDAYIKRQALISLIKNDIKDEKRLNNLIANTGLEFFGERYKVVLLGELAEKYEYALKCIDEFLNKEHMGYALGEEYDERIIILLCYNDDDELEKFKKFIYENFENDIEHGMGRECKFLIDVNNSYKSAVKDYLTQNIAEERFEGEDDSGEKKKEIERNECYIGIMKFIAENYTDNNLSLKMIADVTGKSIYYVSRLIKANLGYNFMDYLSELRIEHAKRLLKETDMKVADIVETVGYLNVPGFNKKFKSVEGMSPTNYRSQFRGE